MGRAEIELYMTDILPKGEKFDVHSRSGVYIGSGAAI